MYKVTKFIFERDEKSNFVNRKYITVKDDITWDEAKKLRKEDKTLQIVKK